MNGTRAWLVVLAACGSAPRPPLRQAPPPPPEEPQPFGSPVTDPAWIAVVPDVMGAQVRVEDGALQLTAPSEHAGDVIVRRKFDAVALRGKRVRLTARARAQAPMTSYAQAVISVTTSAPLPTYAERAATRMTRSLLWVPLRAVLDVPADATGGDIALIQHAAGSAWFDDVMLEVVGPTPAQGAAQLTPDQLANLVAFGRAAAVIRWLHPSDQAAELDWDEWVPSAIDRVLRVPGRDVLPELRALFAPIAPTATFSKKTDPPIAASLPKGNALYLARWRRYGLGPYPPFKEYREGREDDKFAHAIATTRVKLADAGHCKTAMLHAGARRFGTTGTATLLIRALSQVGDAKEFAQSIPRDTANLTMSADLPLTTQAVELELEVVGQTGVTLENLALTCSSGSKVTIDPAAGWWITGLTNLYTWKTSSCSTGTCATLRRNAIDTTFVPARDRIVEDLGDDLQVSVPIAVWADAARTFPAAASPLHMADLAFGDLPSRLATITAAWGALSVFYPYFTDQRLDWTASLAPGLVEAAAAPDGAGLRIALNHMLVGLHDAVAQVRHPLVAADGSLPLAFRRFGDRIVVLGSAPELTTGIPPGSELVALDGQPALKVYDGVAAQVSPSTEGARAHGAAVRLSAGPPGTFRRVRLRSSDGREMERVFPLVDRDVYSHEIRDPRPAPGAEIVPGVYYIDFDALPPDTWAQLLPTLVRARALIFDFRGATSGAGFTALSHLTDHEIDSPTWQTPVLPNAGGPAYLATRWTLRPALPRLTAPVIALLDGQTTGVDETVLQILREHHLGLLVGETSAGANGNDASFRVPGGFEVRFTAMRVVGRDGSIIQGRGITPDKVVHPTVEGIRAGRDEILDAAINAAQQLAPR